MERAVFPNGFFLRRFTSVMIAGLNRSVARANNDESRSQYKIDDKERQQSAMGTQKGAAMRSRHSNVLQENGKIHCLLHGRRLHRCRTPSSLLSHHQSNNVHVQHHFPGIAPIASPQWSKVLTSVLASLQGHNSAGT